jgi:hypothetical protein
VGVQRHPASQELFYLVAFQMGRLGSGGVSGATTLVMTNK